VPVNPDLHRFVHDALSRGIPRETIRSALRGARWSVDEVESELSSWHDLGIGLPVPQRRVGVSAREAFLHLLLFVALYLVAFHTGAILFGWFDRMWPDASLRESFAEPRRDAIRLSVASLLVAFPVFLFTSRVIGQAAGPSDIHLRGGPYRWTVD